MSATASPRRTSRSSGRAAGGVESCHVGLEGDAPRTRRVSNLCHLCERRRRAFLLIGVRGGGLSGSPPLQHSAPSGAARVLTAAGSPKFEPAARRWLVRYLTEGTPSIRDIAKVTASFTNVP